MDNVKQGIRYTLIDLMETSGTRNIDLAEAVGVGKSAVTNWLRGSSSINIENIPAICDYFHITVDEFFGRAKDNAQNAPESLTADEKRLLEAYRALDENMRQAAIGAVEGMLATNRRQGDTADTVAV